MRTNTYKVQPGTFHESDTEDLQVLVLRVSGKLNIRAQETSSIYSVVEEREKKKTEYLQNMGKPNVCFRTSQNKAEALTGLL